MLIVGRGEIGTALAGYHPTWTSVNHKMVASLDPKDWDIVVNCTFDPALTLADYDLEVAFDKSLVEKFSGSFFVNFSTRHVYEPQLNLSEHARKQRPPGSENKSARVYGLNKIVVEEIVVRECERHLNLRLPNIFSERSPTNRFWGEFISGFRSGDVELNICRDCFKDFLYMKDLSIIIDELIAANISGTFNVAYEQKFTLGEISRAVQLYFPDTVIRYGDSFEDQFTLDVTSLGSSINLKRFDMLSAIKQCLEEK